MGRIASVMNAGDEPRLVGAERHGRPGDLFGLADPAHRHDGGCSGLRLRTSTSQVVGEDRSGRPGLDARVVVGVVQRGGLGQADDAVLGRHIPGWVPQGRVVAAYAGTVAATIALQHAVAGSSAAASVSWVAIG